ncbi:cell division protein FtsQ/DivIB [Actinomycetospora callitridis]|uniref:cell division protein FtsQ/DivIB n=1 Tax=Actinomycetospora callitridis TaxID=913944 RepID=UPI0023653024|nr:FtsQ-type POTRA domain-containing protein [Actinomycetospora callitridis]MDD7921837.1 FtsQ-type POTRA domain-containing protein [Actinomycetospora callitridis]
MTGPARSTGRPGRAGRSGRAGRGDRPERTARSDGAERQERARQRRTGGAGARPSGAAAGSPGRATRVARPSVTRPVRRRRSLWAGLAAALALVAVLVWLTVWSPLLDVRDVEVVGAAPDQIEAVRAAAAVAPGTSLLWLDGDEVARDVRTLPRIASVDVSRDYPGTVVVSVTEREPVLAAPSPAGGVLLVDATGFGYRTMPERPPGIPALTLPPGMIPSPDEPATRAAADVAVALPAALRAEVVEVRANGRFDVGFVLTGGREVRWGADADNERKAAVLAALLTRPGVAYDVSTPDLAVVR